MLFVFRILLLAALIAVLASLVSVQLIRAAATVLGDEKLYGESLEDTGSSLRESVLFLDRFLGGKGA